MFNADFRPVVVSNGDVFCYVTADVVTRTQDQGGTGFFDANHWIFQETGQVLRVGFALDDAKGNAHTAEWCAGVDVVFYVSLIATDKALVGLEQCRFIVCMVAWVGFSVHADSLQQRRRL